jgi:hypothetical protein
MLTQAREVVASECETALEAALVEVDVIADEQPLYNTALRARERGQHPAEALTVLARLVRGRQSGDQELALLFAPLRPLAGVNIPRQLLRRGLELFVEIGLAGRETRVDEHTLCALGLAWAQPDETGTADEELPQPDPAEASEGEPATGEEEPEKQWTAQRVFRRLKGIACWSARARLRTSWLQLLAESSLCWRPSRDEEHRARLLVVAQGRPVRVAYLSGDEQVPVPPGWETGLEQREVVWGSNTHDRLRVLNTELKRLLAQDRLREVCLSPGLRLSRKQLAEVLRWV